jgi:transposase InsO family protein
MSVLRETAVRRRLRAIRGQFSVTGFSWTPVRSLQGYNQYTAVDDCTRYRVLGLYKRRTAANTLLFLWKLLEEMPFPIQRIQTDRGTEFFATKVQERLMTYSVKFRLVKPGSPHVNGKVERSQKTDFDKFYATVDLNSSDLEDRL